MLELSRKLATIRRDLTLPLAPKELTRKPADVAVLSALYSRLEMNSLLRQLTGATTQAPASREPASERVSSGGASEPDSRPPVSAPPRQYETILTEKQLATWLSALKKAPLFAFDTETTSLDYMQAEIVGVSFCIEPGKAAYLPLAHDYPGAPDQLDRKKTLARLKPLLEDPKRAKVGHHLKYDAHVLAGAGIALAGMRYDSMLESYVLNSTATRHDMDSCAKLYLGIDTIKYEDVAGKGAKQIPFNQVALEQASPYAAEDADVTLQLHRVLHAALEKQPALLNVYEEIEQPLVPVLLEMEHRGVLVDRRLLKKQSGEIREAPRRTRSRCPPLGRPALQPGLAEAAAGNPVHEAGPAGPAEDPHRPAIDGRGSARGTCGEIPAAAHHPRVPRPREAAFDLHREAARADRRADRPRAHLVSPGGRRDRPAVIQRPEPAEHPDPDGGGPAHPPGLHRAEGSCAALRGLFADRAADHGASFWR